MMEWSSITLFTFLTGLIHILLIEATTINDVPEKPVVLRTNHQSLTDGVTVTVKSHATLHPDNTTVPYYQDPLHKMTRLRTADLTPVSTVPPPTPKVGYDALFPTCKPSCLNGGVCREVQLGSPICVCPTDYRGEQCESPSEKPLDFCNESTCQNHGFCTGTPAQPACSCPPDILGRTCERRVRSYEINLVVQNRSKPLDWNVSLVNPLSTAYKNISSEVTKAIDAASRLGDDLTLVKAYYGSQFLGFGNGTLVARVKVSFDLDDRVAGQYTETLIRTHIVSGGLIILRSEKSHLIQPPTDFGAMNSSLFTLQAINPCLSGNNDCSIHAVCTVIAPGVYTCTCKAFTIDSSMNRAYPGRRCVYDGLIIFTFILVGSLVSMLIFLLCGCRRTIWYRYKNRGHPEHLTLVSMPSNYDI